jgi:hypothetical protein
MNNKRSGIDEMPSWQVKANLKTMAKYKLFKLLYQLQGHKLIDLKSVPAYKLRLDYAYTIYREY